MKFNFVLQFKAIGAKLEQLMSEDKQNMDSVVNLMSDENKQRDAVVEDEEEDFLDDGWSPNFSFIFIKK